MNLPEVKAFVVRGAICIGAFPNEFESATQRGAVVIKIVKGKDGEKTKVRLPHNPFYYTYNSKLNKYEVELKHCSAVLNADVEEDEVNPYQGGKKVNAEDIMEDEEFQKLLSMFQSAKTKKSVKKANSITNLLEEVNNLSTSDMFTLLQKIVSNLQQRIK